jgi:hypothetical protein
MDSIAEQVNQIMGGCIMKKTSIPKWMIFWKEEYLKDRQSFSMQIQELNCEALVINTSRPTEEGDRGFIFTNVTEPVPSSRI